MMGNAFAIVALTVVALVFVLTTGTPLSLARFRWWRRWQGGHWELVDGDALPVSFRGKRWMRTTLCQLPAPEPDRPKFLVCCEDYEGDRK